MSTSATDPRPKFLVYAPDKTEEGTFERRLSVRPDHLAKAKESISGGFIRIAGALSTPETYNTPNKKMVGSMFIVEADDIEEVKKKIEADIYYTSGVWDQEKLVILPMIPATPIP
ncbi:hypothetical protein K435DRAFT_960325 [Dendrothele bispora CBS 962.96]|uniref:YCII-related domain-containing protein n=1 Tax=Dendrothele bispora (strain CBS 962.96) TaxID=1314807 RepID=A0A4S8MU19_DENBC|nr:hypothetical protein K435DRAFT_960325 [Dendrothele bispora CBS 962.96]